MNLKVGVQVEKINLLDSVLKSSCDSIRFGPEFCERKLPSEQELTESYSKCREYGKEFVFVTPRVTNFGLKKIQNMLIGLEAGTRVVVNDLGVLNALLDSHWTLEVGRQLIFYPARCPWRPLTSLFKSHPEIIDVLKESSLNHSETLEFFSVLGVYHFDLDLISDCVDVLPAEVTKNISISLYTGDIMVAVTRKCHTARLLGKAWDQCQRACEESVYKLFQRDLKVELILYGNAVFRRLKTHFNAFKNLSGKNIREIVTTTGIPSEVKSTKQINEFVRLIHSFS